MQDFDKQIRALLEDAEEKVPSGVWNVVSRGLDRAESKKAVPVVWWRRAAVSVAVAAAAVAGVFLFRGEDNSTFQLYNQFNTIAHEGSGIDIPLVAPGDLNPRRNLLAYAPEAANLPEAGVPGADVSDRYSSGAETTGETVSQQPSSVKAPSAPAEENVSSDGEADRLLRELAFEDSKERGRTPASFVLGGNVLSNGNPSTRMPGPTRAILSSAPTKTGISDKEGESAYGIPTSIGLGIRIPLLGRLSLGTGVEYTFLSRTFTGTYTEINSGVVVNSITGDIDNYQHYLGIPVNVFYDVLSGGSTRFYVYGGGTVEKNISNHYRIHSSTGDINWSDPAAGLQFSVGVGLGVEFLLSDMVGLYVDPGLRYYFNCGQPKSIRTAQPLMMNFEVGMRIGL